RRGAAGAPGRGRWARDRAADLGGDGAGRAGGAGAGGGRVTFTVVVALHDSAADLRRLLASIDRWLPDRPQVVCVDSGSSDDGPALARDWGAEVVALDGNRGFGAANVAGVARAAQP